MEPETRWEHFAHEADIGVRGIGPSIESAFEQAAVALTGIMVDPTAVRSSDSVVIDCEGADDDMLLFDWLNALIFEIATRKMLFGRFEVRMDADGLHATAWGEPMQECEQRPAAEPKGATQTALEVSQTEMHRWIAQCVVDV